MMDITKSRKGFEAWLKSRDCNPVGWLKDEYWEVWKSARESIEVELPTQDEYDDPLSAYNAISDCKKILRTAGIRIKGESE
ncbi:hypothetical protein [Yersinia mollaretii]|uniref:hypothetical protein n=1 Tax=Yersinia mollaretii TaxID=33060 RepID=UPI000C154983|nr:hypothetical protein [Yersinia mollaretii]PHZ29643.1 hypothetical protein CS537_21490 [Yersinia mollaretii]WQC76911.1 hypothetical protein U1Z61_10700 [Yersinia mollaretii]